MNVDIEGLELDVLKTINFNYFNIKFICVEIHNFNKISTKRGKLIINLLRKNNYILKKKLAVSYIFKKIN